MLLKDGVVASLALGDVTVCPVGLQEMMKKMADDLDLDDEDIVNVKIVFLVYHDGEKRLMFNFEGLA